jgi:hypothetical protein
MQAPRPLPLLCVLLLFWPGLGQGQTVYKSVDAQGNVTYSNTPPSNAAAVEPIAVRSARPTAADPEAERQPEDAAGQSVDGQRRRDEQRQQRAQQAAAVAAAERRVRAAQEGLEAAKRQRDADRRTPERGGGAGGQAGYERMQQERRKIREAEQALEDAKAGKLPPEETAVPQPRPPGQTKGVSPPADGAPGVRPGSQG